MKVKLFTHGSDIDGNSCAILSQLVFGKENVDIEYCEYSNVNDIVMKSDCFSGEYDYVLITDISISMENAKIFDNNISTLKNSGGKTIFKLLDHHKSALSLNKYGWARVKIDTTFRSEKTHEIFEEMTCGAYELQRYLIELGYFVAMNPNTIINTIEFMNNVRKYDTYLFKTKYNEILPKRINDLYKILGKVRFMNYVYESLIGNGFILSSEYLLMLELHQEKIDKYIKYKNGNITKYKWNEYTMGIVFAEQFISELGNEICVLNPDIDFVAIVSPAYGISYRAVKDVDLSVIAKQIGGDSAGGHRAAAGSPITMEQQIKIIDILFGNKDGEG